MPLPPMTGRRRHPLTWPKSHACRFMKTTQKAQQTGNQTMRQPMRRFARVTAAHSKKIDNHVHMVALNTTWYNFARINNALRMSPAIAARLTERLWTWRYREAD